MQERSVEQPRDLAAEDAAAAAWLFNFRQAPEFHNPSVSNFWYWHTVRVLEEVRRACLAHPADTQVVVDFGCGDGLLAERILREIPTAHLTAIDLKPGDIQFLRTSARYLNREDRLSAVVGNLYRTHLASRVADIAICSEVVEHLTNDLDALKEIHRVLRPSGVLILATPNPNNLLSRAARLLRGSRGGQAAHPDHEPPSSTQAPDTVIHGHINERPVSYWRTQMERAGFRVERVLPVTTRYGSVDLSHRPASFAASLLLQALAARIPGGYRLSCGIVATARRR
jgi:SAM-dependent methyltransferase